MADMLDEFGRRYELPAAALRELRTALGTTTLRFGSVEGPGPTLAPDPASGEGDFTLDLAPGAPSERYTDLGLIGQGGMAEVRRVRDHQLDRDLAMKIIDGSFMARPSVLARFLDEARTMARLEHPGIVPVHELGTTPDGRICFTMQEVRGRTLTQVIQSVHAASQPDAWGATEDGWSLARLVDAFRRACEAVAHAHAHGVLHRDIKPENIMVGPLGEVLVMDWGLARAGVGEGEPDAVAPTDPRRTRPGTLAGTPLYMPPEQARGALDQLGPQADVYSLGILLYEALYGAPPFAGLGVREVLERVQAGGLESPEDARPVPAELVELWRGATALDPADRPAHAGILAERVRAGQEGARRRERALAVVAEARALLPEVASLRQEAEALAGKAAERAEALRPWDPIEEKRASWRLEDEAEALSTQAEREELRAAELLRAALVEDPGLPEARRMLADMYQARHAEAEARRDLRAAARWEVLLRAHDDGRHAAWLRAEGRLSLSSHPPARARLLRYVLQDRRLEPVFERDLGQTPLLAVRLPAGSWLVELEAPGHGIVRYPVHIGRRDHWNAVPPGESRTAPVPLLVESSLCEDEVYVPPGWCIVGGDTDAAGGGPRRQVWLDGFVIQRFPVTNRAFISFLNDLVEAGREEEALLAAPRERLAGGDNGPLVYGRDAAGRFFLRTDADGDRWDPDWPVMLVDEAGAVAYAGWLAARTGHPWRLPWELEWEKAARGVDGRLYPWGDTVDSTWARVRDSRPGRHLPARIDEHPDDRSPYGVRGMAGNVMDRCLDAFVQGGALIEGGRPVWRPAGDAPRVARGGAWSFSSNMARVCMRAPMLPGQRRETLGFRLVRALPTH